MTDKTSSPNIPGFIAYHVPEREGAPWARIGVAWAHKDGKGFNVELDLIPVGTGRIVVRTYEPKDDSEQS